MIEVYSLPSQPRNWRRVIIFTYFLLLIFSCAYWRDLNHYAVISVGIITFCLIHETAKSIIEGILTSIAISLAAITLSWLIVAAAYAFRYTDTSVLDERAKSYVTGAAVLVICSGILAALVKLFWTQKNR